ncbi:hypothetical protein [Bacillus wiedmannii]|uniref:hypothetical protein n=1 Tax=Bacillus wiedmannii TaxID=1890302 RepID=UPI000BF219C8|nr:hypothetical protein [Bacillus wiedmannii]PEN68503.1 hypothetical protein CN576_03500 [Bacillus wiedmannii]PFZ50769.1 hypothetical protein COL58_05820 [Bacillus wiedmannii]
MNKLEKLLVSIIKNEIVKDGDYELMLYKLNVDYQLEIKLHDESNTYLIFEFDEDKLLYASQSTEDIVKFIDKELNEPKPILTSESIMSFENGKLMIDGLPVLENTMFNPKRFSSNVMLLK